MDHLTWRDGAATLLVAALVAAYAGWLVLGSMPLVHSAGDVAAIAFIFGFAACLVAARPDAMSLRLAALTGVLLVGLGIAALVSENGAVLAVFVALTVTMFAVSTARHAGFGLHGARGRSHHALT